MATLNDLKLVALQVATGQTGTVNDLEKLWLESELSTTGALPDLWKAWLASKGFSSGSWNTDLYEYLGSLGYTGSLNDRLIQWYTAGLSTLPAFWGITFDETTFEMLGVRSGTGDLTEARTGSLYAPDHEDIYREFPTTEPAYWGGRKVENLWLQSEDMTQAPWQVVLGATIDSAQQLTLPTTQFSAVRQLVTPVSTDAEYRLTADIRLISGDLTGALIEIDIDGARTDITSLLTSSWQRITSNVGTFAGALNRPVLPVTRRIVGSGGDLVFGLKNVQLELVSGQTDQDPAEYIQTTTDTIRKVFANVNGNSVASNVVTEATGAALAEAPYVLAQPAQTNTATWSRDQTNAAWTKVGTSVAALNATGIDGAANAATTLTDDDGGAFEYVERIFTVPDDSNTHTVIYRIAKDTNQLRFPRFDLVLSGGTTSQGVLARINTQTGASFIITSLSAGTYAVEVVDVGDFWHFYLQCANNSTGNTSLILREFPANDFGLINDPGGDAAATGSIVVDCVDLRLNTTIAQCRQSSPIFTTSATVTTNQTDLSFDIANHDNTQGGYFFEWVPFWNQPEGFGQQALLTPGAASNGVAYYQSNADRVRSFDGSTEVTSPIAGFVSGTPQNVGVAYGDTRRAIRRDGTWGTEGAYDGAFDVGAVIGILEFNRFAGLIRNIRRYNQDYDAARTTLEGLDP